MDFDPVTEELTNPIEIWRVGLDSNGNRCFYALKTCSDAAACTDSEENEECVASEDPQ